jgi:hypothetical protein
MLGRDAAALAGRLAAGDPAFDWQPLATFMAAASAPDETREAAATHEARAFAVSEEQEEEEARAAAAPPAVRSQDGAPGSSTARPIELHEGEEDATPGGTAPLPFVRVKCQLDLSWLSNSCVQRALIDAFVCLRDSLVCYLCVSSVNLTCLGCSVFGPGWRRTRS